MGVEKSAKSYVGKAKKAKLVTIGDVAPDFELVDPSGAKHKLSSFRGKRVLLSFYRFAACPICQYNVDRLRQQTDLFKRAGVVTLSVYKSTPENVRRYGPASESDTSLALSDTQGIAFKKFMLPKSLRAAVGGSFAILAQSRFRRFLELSNALRDACWGTNMDMIRQLPGDFMIDENGVIVDLFRAEKMIDQMPFDRVEAFIPEENRCKCNKKDCIVPRCRENYEEIRKQSAAMIYTGGDEDDGSDV